MWIVWKSRLLKFGKRWKKYIRILFWNMVRICCILKQPSPLHINWKTKTLLYFLPQLLTLRSYRWRSGQNRINVDLLDQLVLEINVCQFIEVHLRYNIWKLIHPRHKWQWTLFPLWDFDDYDVRAHFDFLKGTMSKQCLQHFILHDVNLYLKIKIQQERSKSYLGSPTPEDKWDLKSQNHHRKHVFFI